MKWITINKPWSTKRFQGYDLNENMYFEEPRPGYPDTVTKRTVLCKESNHFSRYEKDFVSVEFQMWLRHTRTDFPSPEEEICNRQRALETQDKIMKLSEKEYKSNTQSPENENSGEYEPQKWDFKK